MSFLLPKVSLNLLRTAGNVGAWGWTETDVCEWKFNISESFYGNHFPRNRLHTPAFWAVETNYGRRRPTNVSVSLVFVDGWRRRPKVAERCSRPELWLHVQVADHRQLERRKDQFPVSLRRRLVHVSIRLHRRHWLQSENCLSSRQACETSNMGNFNSLSRIFSTCQFSASNCDVVHEQDFALITTSPKLHPLPSRQLCWKWNTAPPLIN